MPLPVRSVGLLAVYKVCITTYIMYTRVSTYVHITMLFKRAALSDYPRIINTFESKALSSTRNKFDNPSRARTLLNLETAVAYYVYLLYGKLFFPRPSIRTVCTEEYERTSVILYSVKYIRYKIV